MSDEALDITVALDRAREFERDARDEAIGVRLKQLERLEEAISAVRRSGSGAS